ncbi:hypothetical protein A2415_03095 [candidate division WWE3 bacterium RIFOXYC1_FULL_39_7]|uniref:Uncharacterized protein n=2 Tax=Katanobacteria TaxID=422282 RepID=A0A1F4X8K9_UNCKA|nr:MAG: hypothetical protein A2415_03095 [candidate division WWE3 bacterium RIFOXYC1_FULL_39_7]OGC78016.1 MAG: hypothetical protein A2619_02945 [candidate division WWE3 bacterium RIFOXYD1_FULL_39_9]
MFPVTLMEGWEVFAELHYAVAYVGGGILGFCGFYLLILSVLSYDVAARTNRSKARKFVADSFMLIGVATVVLIFGFYALVPIAAGALLGIIYIFIKGIWICVRKEPEGEPSNEQG